LKEKELEKNMPVWFSFLQVALLLAACGGASGNRISFHLIQKIMPGSKRIKISLLNAGYVIT